MLVTINDATGKSAKHGLSTVNYKLQMPKYSSYHFMKSIMYQGRRKQFDFGQANLCKVYFLGGPKR